MKARTLDIITAKICPYCGGKPVLENSKIVYGKDYGLIYHCRPCKAWVGVHKNSVRAFGRLANEELRKWKKQAHEAFDPIWHAKVNRGMERFKARNSTYEWLSEQMGLDIKYTHIGMFDVNQCKKVIELCKSLNMKKAPAKKEEPKKLNRTEAINAILKLVEKHNGTVNAIINDYLVTDGAELEIGTAGNNLWNEIEALHFEDEPEENFDSVYKKLENLSSDELNGDELEKIAGLFSDGDQIDFLESVAVNKGYALIKVNTLNQREKLQSFAETEIWPHYNQQHENILI